MENITFIEKFHFNFAVIFIDKFTHVLKFNTPSFPQFALYDL